MWCVSCLAEEDKLEKSQKEKKEVRDLQMKQRRYILPDIHIPLSIPPTDEDLNASLNRLQYSNGFHDNNNNNTGYHSRLERILRNNRKRGTSQPLSRSAEGLYSSASDSGSYTGSHNGITSKDSRVRLPSIEENNRPSSWSEQNRNKLGAMQLRKNAFVSRINDAEEQTPRKKRVISKKGRKGYKGKKSKKGNN